jgi:pimeloyl-ACP methyl ester carboxylesterase
MYAGGAVPPSGYSLETEVEGIRRVADDAGFDTFHLVGYSAGGASSLAFASRDPERLRSLVLMEPAWAGRTGQSPEEAAVFDLFRAIPELPPDKIMPAFIRTQLAAGVEPPPPPPGPPPPWMPSRLAGIGGFIGAFDAFEPDFDMLRRFDRPVYFAPGWPRQSRPLSADRGASGGRILGLHARSVRRPPSLRPAAPGGTSAARCSPSRLLDSSRDESRTGVEMNC